MICKAVTKKGEPCKCNAIKNSGLCWFQSDNEYRRMTLEPNRHLPHCLTRRRMVKQLNNDIKALEGNTDIEVIRIRSRLMTQLKELMDDLDFIGKLKEAVRKQEER